MIVVRITKKYIMQIVVQSPGFKASETLKAFINEKAGKLAGLSQKIIRVDVTLFIGASSELRNKYCEIRLEVPGNDHYVKKNGNSFEQSVTESVDAIRHMIEKDKDKEIGNRHAH
jgi:ribosome hibernation promoting factor